MTPKHEPLTSPPRVPDNGRPSPFPTTFFAPPSGLSPASWAAFALVFLVGGLAMLLPVNPNRVAIGLSFAIAVILAGLAAAAWLERKRRLGPALEIDQVGLRFWRGTAREQFLPWDQLEKVGETGGWKSMILFDVKGAPGAGRRRGPAVPVGSAAEDGTRLEEVIGDICAHFEAQRAVSASPIR